MNKEQYIATLIGTGIGDALGMPVEGMKPQQIQRYAGRITDYIDPVIPKDPLTGKSLLTDEFGKLKQYNQHNKAGDYTDDTILGLALAEALADHGRDITMIAQYQLEAYQTANNATEGPRGGFGQTTVQAMEQLSKGFPATESGVIGGPGNGPAMKIAPFGLDIYAHDDLDVGLVYAHAIGKITHLDPRSLVSGQIQAAAIYLIGKKCTKQEFREQLYLLSNEHEQPTPAHFSLADQGTFTERLAWIVAHHEATSEEAYHTLGSGSKVYASHPFALFMFQKYWEEPLEGLIKTINYGGDCDTTGAMFGALAGAQHGMFFPDYLLEGLRGRERLEHAATRLWNRHH